MSERRPLDRKLIEQVQVDWATQRIINMYAAWRERMVDVLVRLGVKSTWELRGRHDCLRRIRRGEEDVDD